MIDEAFVRKKLADLSCYLQDLQQVANHSLDEYTNNLFVKRTGERTIELIVECAVDINNHFILEVGSAIPSEYFQSFLDMASLSVISESLARALAPTAGLRNRLAHEYETVIDRIVYDAIHRIIANYAEYINQIQEWLSVHEFDEETVA
jgi:uncharacterized protein YutE (UPF0331/DUF86 family)